MDRVAFIIISLLISLLVYLGFVFALRGERGRRHICRHWYYHPNAICVWRVFIGILGMLLYFAVAEHFWGILLLSERWKIRVKIRYVARLARIMAHVQG